MYLSSTDCINACNDDDDDSDDDNDVDDDDSDYDDRDDDDDGSSDDGDDDDIGADDCRWVIQLYDTDILVYLLYMCSVSNQQSYCIYIHSLNDDNDTITSNHNPMLSHTSQES